MDYEVFITEVQNHTVLYDTSHAFYKDNARKEKAWSEVAAVLGCTANDCKTRWRQLRDSFVRHKKKTSLPGSSAGASQRDWKYADLMSFLIPFIQLRSSKSNLGSMPTSGAVEGEEAGEGDRSETTSSLRSCASSPIPPLSVTPVSVKVEGVTRSRSPIQRAPRPGKETTKKKKTTHILDLEDRLMGVLQEPPPKPDVPITEQDEAYHFALSTVPLLLNLNKSRRRQAKQEITRILDLLNEEEEGEHLAASQHSVGF
nr:uncharacterized protein LOC107393322 [Nothobranchius furzeri]